MSILIVDDDPTIRDLTSLLLSQAGFTEIATADSGAKALQILGIDPPAPSEFIPDVILMDIMMPGIDGIETCARIKREETFADIPVLMVTTLNDVEHLKKAFIAGATDYMNKPIRAEELLARVKSAHRLKQEAKRRKQREVELERMSLENPVAPSRKQGMVSPRTGLPGEAILLGTLGVALARARSSGAVTLLSLDAAESFSTRYGEEKLGEVMSDIATLLCHQPARLGDLLLQTGPAQFALYLPQGDVEQAETQANALRAAIAALQIPHEYSPVGPALTASAAVLSFANTPLSPADFLAAAYGLIERAQSSGGNQILVQRD
ncbi:MAG TPA: response regulator [Alphaproteobacteria bacterium]|nr:response regulator [Alphaproteobacteria bacterium]